MQGLLTDEFAIATCLERHAASVRETSPAAWEFALADRRGSVRLEPEWLLLDIPLDRARSKAALSGKALAQTLFLAGRIDGLAKFAFDPAAKRLHLQAEVPLVLEEDPMERIDLTFAGFEQSLALLHELKETAGSRQDQVPAGGDESPSAAPDDDEELKERCLRWKQLCSELTWPVHPRGSTKLAVSLDVPGSFCQALVEAAGTGSVRIRHEAGKTVPGDVSLRGLSVFLLTASRVVRMARAYAEEEAAGAGGSAPGGEGESSGGNEPGTRLTAFGWELVLGDPPAPFELDRALGALSMACRMTTNELSVLADDETARRYLAVQGMVP